MARARSFLSENLEAVVFFVAMLTITTLLVWWGVFSYGLVAERAALERDALERTAVPTQGPATVSQDAALRAVEDRAARQRSMIWAEGATFGALMLVCVGAMFVVARRRRAASARLVRLLQFTTHELKTPIAGMRALLQSLQLGSIPEEARARFLAQGLLECNRLDHLAEAILSFQRATSKARLQPVSTSSENLVGEILEHRRQTLGGTEPQRARIEPAHIVVDKDAFRVVLENLLDNARKYGGGEPTEILEQRTNGGWRIDVVDRGQGFAQGAGERLFEPFGRDTKSGSATHGSGLGLYIARQLAHAMGGTISARSDGLGQGAVFSLEVPLADEDHA